MRKRIVTTTSVFEPGYPGEKAIERLAGLGFESLDMALDYWVKPDSPFLNEGYLQWAKGLRAKAEQTGISYTHAHAPGEAAGNPHILRSIEVAGVLGAKFMVLHPQWRREDGSILEDEEEFIQRNAEAVRPWLETAERCGVVILTENLLWGASVDPRIVARLVQRVNSEWFGWCYDVGHANCFGFGPSVVTECAVPPQSLHLQDNHGGGDEHLIPGDGTVDWEGTVAALKAVGYGGDCVLEAHHQSLHAPDDERDEILLRLLDRAKWLRENMEA